MTSKPASYPFLAIAKKHNVPYADVLAHADWQRSDNGNPQFPIFSQIDLDICAAGMEQQLIRNGTIDWQTGEPTPAVKMAQEISEC